MTLEELRKVRPGPPRPRGRRAPHLTQAEVADLVGIDRSRYTSLETGKHTLTPYYAAKLEPVLGAGVWRLAVAEPTLAEPARELSIPDRLRALEVELTEIRARLAELERDHE